MSKRLEVRDQLTAAMRAHQQGLPIDPQRQTVGQFLERWLTDAIRADASTESGTASISRRTVPLPGSAIRALRAHRARQLQERLLAGSRWQDTGFVFTTSVGTPCDPHTIRRRYKSALKAAGLPPQRCHDLRTPARRSCSHRACSLAS
jgi:integrase